MKNISLTYVQLLFVFLLLGCTGGDDECTNPLTIGKVFPFSTSTGSPVLIEGQGFSSGTVVRFGTVKSTVLEVNENYISTKVPTGLQGLVELSLANGNNCLATTDFEVTSSSTAISPASPPIYIIPNAGSAFPPVVGTDENLSLLNIYDESNEIFIVTSNFGSDGYEIAEGYQHSIFVEFNTDENFISIFIDRSDLRPYSNMPDEHLEGKFYNLTLSVNGRLTTGNFLVAFSKFTGHQYIFKAI